MVQRPPVLDMRPDGTFRAPPPQGGVLFTTKVALGAGLVAVLGGALLMAALMVWFVSLVLPAVVIAAGVAFVALKLRGWQLRRTPVTWPVRHPWSSGR